MGNLEYLINTSQNNLYNIFLDEKKEIKCISSKQNKWADYYVISQNSSSDMDITIDTSDNIHLFNVEDSNKVNYFIFNKQKWRLKTSFNLTAEGEKIFYPICTYHSNQINLFYYEKNSVSSLCKLKHVVFEKNKAKENLIFQASYHRFINPFKVFTVNNNMIFLFTSLVNDKDEIFIKKFDSQKEEWLPPMQITNTGVSKLYLDGLLDNSNNIHILWSNYTEDDLTINYIKYNLEENNVFIEPQKLSESLNCSFPHITLYNSKVIVVWYQFEHLVTTTSYDFGDTWSEVKPIAKSKRINFKRYRFRTNYNEYSNFIGDTLFGTLYPAIQFLGLGGDIDDEVSTGEL